MCKHFRPVGVHHRVVGTFYRCLPMVTYTRYLYPIYKTEQTAKRPVVVFLGVPGWR